jgi:hypothetical protein
MEFKGPDGTYELGSDGNLYLLADNQSVQMTRC